MDRPDISTLGQLKQSGWLSRSVKQELRDNLVQRLREGKPVFEGIHGYEDTVLPALERAILAGHSINLLGLRGQAKTRMARGLVQLLDEWMPVVDGSELHDDPLRPISRHARDLLAEHGDDTPIAWVHRDARHALFESGKVTIMLMFIIANALILKHVLTDEQIPQMITDALLSAGFGAVMFLVIVNVILLIGGQFMEPSGLVVIVAPLVFPIAIELGIDPIHLGIIMVVNMEIGMITPPVGLNLFVTSSVAAMPMMRVVKAALPWLGILFLFLIIVTYVPWISTVLPTWFMGPEMIIR